MRYTDKWWSYPAEAENGKIIIVTGRDEIEHYRENGKYHFRVDVVWDYHQLPDGMPEEGEAELMEQATDALLDAFKKERGVGVMTGIYTGDGRREWVFYTCSLPIFQKVFNRALETVDQMPLMIDAQDDPDWQEYAEMRESTYIPDED